MFEPLAVHDGVNQDLATHNTAMPQPSLPSSLPTVLLTGFDAFGGDTVNPSWLAAKALHDDVVHGHRCVAAQLPTTFAGSEGVLLKLLRTHKPSLVICLGLAGGRPAFSLERIAINVPLGCDKRKSCFENLA